MLQCIVVTPERTVRDEPAQFVVLPLYDGEIGIAPGHTPLVGRLGAGEMRITGQSGVSRFYLEGGFVEVLGNVVSVLTPQVIPADQLDPAVAEEQLRSVRTRPAKTPEEIAARQRLSDQYRAQLRVIRRAR
jgi:F-type H+-transporting ATPase subunit epsilon